MMHPMVAALSTLRTAPPYGRVTAIGAGRIEASGPAARLGDFVEIAAPDGPVTAQVVAVSATAATLMPLDREEAVAMDARVVAARGDGWPTGDGFAGRAVDALGCAIDGGAAIPLAAHPPRAPDGALDRVAPSEALATGIRAIDGLLTLGRGQRIGIFAASGVGKTTLVEQLASQIACDRLVVCLIGERGREVGAFWERMQPAGGTLVAATSDESPVLRARAAEQALALAEHWRDRGEHVLFVLDSATRLAMALREIGLAAGAPPTMRAYTPNVFSALPRVVERCGARRSGGAITAIMTVLTETDDGDDPVAELMKSLLDGHIVLGRDLADRGHFPAIHVVRSVSRQAERLVDKHHAAHMRAATALLADYEENRIMIESGVYRPGADPRIDRAIAARETLGHFLRQNADERVEPAATMAALAAALGGQGG
jgi:flagellum-specific ATP synthase